jgi:hypothetical protein
MSVQGRQFVNVQPVTLGWIIAVIVLILAIILMVIGQLDFKVGGLIAALAIARLL